MISPLREHARAVVKAAHRLDAPRRAWRNPPEGTHAVPEMPGEDIPHRRLALNHHRHSTKARS